ncbi:tRNA pseudouridine(55) synthase TruB [Agarivorans gilvus]|uniref:tRNA pseudouridine synthase B n=1 Tax=Agarivorans gilvus TaxID=680279 RepID=A0ABQ1HZB4_9ALTE|nr:tRNA pseudouridine(55) synthase TruB [Agarivorans gilvus]GGB00097.1 tRNA pseudouridine synthase B [Agarivorans gilvus]
MGQGRRKKGRAIDGVLLLNKPTGVSSNGILQRVKRIYFAQKAGHTGALDPLATGMLPICLGEATKFSQFLLDSDKRYQVTAQLGVRTNTSDSDGEIVEQREVRVNAQDIEAALQAFRGPINQVPSMFSALKHQGKPLYAYAREGITIEREARPITVYENNFISLEGDMLTLDVHCSKGTYIRTIIDDLGEALGCGAHVVKLHRSQVATYPSERMVSLELLETLLEQAQQQEIAPKDLLDPLLLPMDSAVAHLAEVNIPQALGDYLLHGQPLQIAGAPLDQVFRLTIGEQRRFVGIGQVNDDGLVAPKRLIQSNDS